MEFLYKLYDNKYFGITLFIVIAILIFLFLLILFFGKKDEKKRKLEETKKLELENANTFKETNENVESLEIQEIAQPNLGLENTSDVSNEVIQNNIEQSNDDILLEIPKLNIDDVVVKPELNSSIQDDNAINNLSFELPKIDESIEKNDDNNELNDINIDDLFQTNIELPKEDEKIENNLSVEPVKEEVQENLNSTFRTVEAPFSSVYINKEENVIANKEPEKNTSFSPMFELPKMADNKEVSDLKEESKIDEKEEKVLLEEKKEQPEVTRVSDFDSLFGDIETETYSIDK